MALFSESKLKKLRYPYNTARMVSLVKAIETSDAGGKYWSKTEAEEITAELIRETTPGSKASDFIQKRAALAFSRMSKRSPTLLTMKLNYGSRSLVALCLILGSYLLGAFGERFLSTGAEINLFSPIYLFIFGWSLFLYAALIILGLVSIVRRRHIEFPLRTTLAKLSDGLFAPKIITSGIRQEFLKIWTPTVLRLSQFRIARILHWAFLAFTAGVISSIIVRGLGHTYLIGWDIVGLHNSPDNVCDIFNTLFGWIPAALNLGPLPDVNTVAAMRLDRLQDAATTSAAAASAFAPAASWLPRLFILYGVVVLIPRLLLILWDTLGIRIRSERLPFEMDGYFADILRTAEAAVAGVAAATAAAAETVHEAAASDVKDAVEVKPDEESGKQS